MEQEQEQNVAIFWDYGEYSAQSNIAKTYDSDRQLSHVSSGAHPQTDYARK